MVCLYALIRLGDNASHIAEDGGQLPMRAAPTRGGSHRGFGRGGLLELRAEKNGVSEMGLSDIFRFEASCAYT